jgi:hypothetical protein
MQVTLELLPKSSVEKRALVALGGHSVTVADKVKQW